MKNSVIVVGSGLAGMVASMAACEKDTDVMLIDRGSMGIGTNSALANGCFSGPFSGYSAEDYIADTLKSGRLLNYEPMVKMTAKEAPASFGLLKSLGIILDEAGTSYYMVRTPRPEIIPGIVLVKKVAEAVRRTAGIEFVGGFYVMEADKGWRAGLRGKGVRCPRQRCIDLCLRRSAGYRRRGRHLRDARQPEDHDGAGLPPGGRCRDAVVGHGVRPVHTSSAGGAVHAPDTPFLTISGRDHHRQRGRGGAWSKVRHRPAQRDHKKKKGLSFYMPLQRVEDRARLYRLPQGGRFGLGRPSSCLAIRRQVRFQKQAGAHPSRRTFLQRRRARR